MKGSSGGVDIWVRNNYINIPVIVKYMLRKILFRHRASGWIFSLGKIKVKSGGNSAVLDYGIDGMLKYDDGEAEETQSIDVSAALGFSYKFTSKLDASFRYNLGLTDFIKDNRTDDKVRNMVMQMGIGYRF